MENSKNAENNTVSGNGNLNPEEPSTIKQDGVQNGEKVKDESKEEAKAPEFEIVNEDYKTIQAEPKEKGEDEDEDDKDKKKKKKKKKQKKDKKKDESDDEGQEPGVTKKVKKPVTAYDNENIPAELRQKYGDYEKNPLCVAVANIPLGVSMTELKGYFTTLLSSLKSDSPNPIRHIEIGSTKNFAILELDTKELAQFCLRNLDNLELQSYKLKIERPQGFFNKVYDAEAEGKDPFGNISTNATQDDQRIYMGSIPLYLREEDIRKLCESFGLLRFFNLVKDSEGGHKGYCFFEYTDPKCAEKAVKHLEGLEIGDKKLKVQRVTSTSTGPAFVPRLDKEGPKPTNAGGSFLLGFPNISDPNVQTMLNTPFSARTPSRVIQLLNMCTIEDLMEDEYYRELREDIMEECSKFGPVTEIDIPRPDPKTGIAGPSVGKIFVKFQYLIPAKQARYRLAGRTYDKRTVLASFYPEDKYDAKEYLYNPY